MEQRWRWLSTHAQSHSRIVKGIPDQRPTCTVDVRVLLAENKGDLAFTLQITVADLDQGVVGFTLAEGGRMDAGVSLLRSDWVRCMTDSVAK